MDAAGGCSERTATSVEHYELPVQKAKQYKEMVEKLIAVKTAKDSPLTEAFMLEMLDYADAYLLSDETLVSLQAPVTLCGDIHGDYLTLTRIFSYEGYPPEKRYLFLGDYVDRGTLSLEVIVLLLLFKVLYPNEIFLLRGNHEVSSMNRIYGFKREVGVVRYTKVLWLRFQTTFNCLPLAATINDRIFCVHGGLSFRLQSLDQIRQIQRPLNLPNDGLVLDLLWADPSSDVQGFEPNEMRNASFSFGEDVIAYMLSLLGVEMVIRAHEVVSEGFEICFKGALITLFTCPNYTLNNKAGVMNVSSEMVITFTKFQGRRMVFQRRPKPPLLG